MERFDDGAQRALDLRWWSRRGRGAEGRGRDGKRGGGGVLTKLRGGETRGERELEAGLVEEADQEWNGNESGASPI